MKCIRSVVVLTGAGISAESGLPTFRGVGGIWENHRVEDVASPQTFARDPRLVHCFYNMRRRQLLSSEIQPNTAHMALANFEEDFSGKFLLVTQNIDHLHEQAGSNKVLHMHGELLKKRCQKCYSITAVREDITIEHVCDRCGAHGTLRPHVVWFGEMPLGMNCIHQALSECDVFVSVGTSGNVYPAAGFVEIVNANGGHSIEINLQPSAMESSFDQKMYGPAGVTLPLFLQRLRAGIVIE